MVFRKLQPTRWIPALLLMGLSLTALPGCQGSGIVPGLKSSAATAAIGMVDVEALDALEEFKSARSKFEAEAKKLQETTLAALPKNPRNWSAEDQKKVNDTRQKIQKLENDLVTPLKQRGEAAILAVSRDKKLSVMLDKRIVVTGVTDYTEEVKKLFQSKDELKLGDPVDTSKSPIGYFDQEVISTLKVFQKIEIEIYKKRADLQKVYEQKAPDLSPAEQEMLKRDLTIQLEAFKEMKQGQLHELVNGAVKEVAVQQAISLVLDKQHVLQGGRNMTTDVVDAFLKKATPAVTKGPKSSPTPSGRP